MYQIRFCAQARICFPNGSAGKESACNTRSAGGMGSIPGLGRAPGGMATQSSIFARKSQGQRVWLATAPGVAKSLTQLSTYDKSQLVLAADVSLCFTYNVW